MGTLVTMGFHPPWTCGSSARWKPALVAAAVSRLVSASARFSRARRSNPARPSPRPGSRKRCGATNPPSGVLTTLQGYVFHLRQALEPPRAKGASPSLIVTVPGGYRLQTVVGRRSTRSGSSTSVAEGRSLLAENPGAAAAGLLG